MSNWPVAILVDKRNFAEMRQALIDCVQGELIGLDLETQDENRHEGLNKLMKINDDGIKAKNAKLFFDILRTEITGMSLYKDGDGHAFYINLGHADVENRLDFHDDIMPIISQKPPASHWIAHNAVFERVMLRACKEYDLGPNVICTMYLAAAAFGDDEYDKDDFLAPGLGGIEKLFPQILREFALYTKGDKTLTNEQQELLSKVVAKESDAEHSYVGYIKKIAYGHGLKALVKKFIGYEQKTFQETLNGKAHMGQLTGEEVRQYGADDAWCAVWLYHKLLAYCMVKNPAVIPVFFEVDNPMTEVYADVWLGGLRVNIEAIEQRRNIERGNYAKALRTMKAAVLKLLPFDKEPHEKLFKYDLNWYGAKEGKTPGYNRYRQKVIDWANSPDSDDDFTIAYQVRGSVSRSWAEDKGLPESTLISISHYMPCRTLLYDLCGCSYMMYQGKTQSDADAQKLMLERLEKKFAKGEIEKERFEAIKTILVQYRELARIDTVMKLFIQTYLLLTDPETGRMYPILSATLNTLRMSMSSPNGQQLSKFGESSYVRGFFIPDDDDSLIVSQDWSSVELVMAGEKSLDPTFLEMYGQRPYKDLHRITAAFVLDMDMEDFLKHPMAKEWRTKVGKTTNFSVVYSGTLNSTAQEMGWSTDEMWEKTGKFWEKYATLKEWRDGVIIFGRENGYIEMANGHRRVRYEATYEWQNYMRQKWQATGNPILMNFGDLMIKKIANRASNQLINATIQGACGEMLKRANLKQRPILKSGQFRARHMMDVHDEVVYSVNRNDIIHFIPTMYETMINHPEIVKHVVLDASTAIGWTYEPYDAKKAPLGQIELGEMNKGLPCIPEARWGQPATQEEVQIIINYLFEKRDELRKAK